MELSGDKKKRALGRSNILKRCLTVRFLLICLIIQVMIIIFLVIKLQKPVDYEEPNDDSRIDFSFYDDFSETIIKPKPEIRAAAKAKDPLALKFFEKYNTAIVILTYVRNEYLTRMMKTLKTIPGITSISKLYISQQSMLHPLEMSGLSAKSLNSHISGRIKQIFRSNDLIRAIDMPIPISHLRKFRPFMWQTPRTNVPSMIAQHYLFAFNKIFDDGVEFLMILEDDVIPELDFLNFMNQLAPFLIDPSEKVYCVTSWNDFGYGHFHTDDKKVFRTEYFPGLGWMIHKSFWFEVRERWPLTSWDWWMIAPSTGNRRDCLAPSRSRNHNIGQDEATNPEVFETWLKVVHSTTDVVDLGDLSYLHLETYNNEQQKMVNAATLLDVDYTDFSVDTHPDGVYLIPYTSPNLAKVYTSLGLDSRYEPNTHHNFLITLSFKNHVILLADMVRCPYLKQRPNFQLEDYSHIVPIKSAVGEDCTSACRRYQLECEEEGFDYINDCSTLAEHFGCTECHPMVITGYIRVAPCGHISESTYFKNYCFYIAQWFNNPLRCNVASKKMFPAQRLCPCANP